MQTDFTNVQLAIGVGLDPLLKRREVATLLGVAVATLDRLRIDDADFPRPIQISLRRIAWRASDVRAYVEAKANSAS